MNPISFPGLGIGPFTIPTDIVRIGNFRVTWYGVLIALGLVLAMLYAMKRAKDFKISLDDLTDVLIFSLIFGVIGARLYYVIFDPTRSTDYKSFLDVVSIWNGGLGIYGGIIAAFVTAYIVCRIKKISVGAVFDLASLGFLIGQGIGRWGNFINQEAYGSATNLPWGMKIYDYLNTETYITVHPCFLYESMWCILGFVLLHIYSKKHRKFNGEIFLMYMMWYGFGRFFIEGLRTDSLYIGLIKISQLVAALLVIGSLIYYIYRFRKYKESTAGEYVSVYGDAAKALAEQEEEIKDLQGEHDEGPEETDNEEDDKSGEGTDGGEEEIYPDDEPEEDGGEKKN